MASAGSPRAPRSSRFGSRGKGKDALPTAGGDRRLDKKESKSEKKRRANELASAQSRVPVADPLAAARRSAATAAAAPLRRQKPDEAGRRRIREAEEPRGGDPKRARLREREDGRAARAVTTDLHKKKKLETELLAEQADEKGSDEDTDGEDDDDESEGDADGSDAQQEDKARDKRDGADSEADESEDCSDSAAESDDILEEKSAARAANLVDLVFEWSPSAVVEAEKTLNSWTAALRDGKKRLMSLHAVKMFLEKLPPSVAAMGGFAAAAETVANTDRLSFKACEMLSSAIAADVKALVDTMQSNPSIFEAPSAPVTPTKTAVRAPELAPKPKAFAKRDSGTMTRDKAEPRRPSKGAAASTPNAAASAAADEPPEEALAEDKVALEDTSHPEDAAQSAPAP